MIVRAVGPTSIQNKSSDGTLKCLIVNSVRIIIYNLSYKTGQQSAVADEGATVNGRRRSAVASGGGRWWWRRPAAGGGDDGRRWLEAVAAVGDGWQRRHATAGNSGGRRQ